MPGMDPWESLQLWYDMWPMLTNLVLIGGGFGKTKTETHRGDHVSSFIREVMYLMELSQIHWNRDGDDADTQGIKMEKW